MVELLILPLRQYVLVLPSTALLGVLLPFVLEAVAGVFNARFDGVLVTVMKFVFTSSSEPHAFVAVNVTVYVPGAVY